MAEAILFSRRNRPIATRGVGKKWAGFPRRLIFALDFLRSRESASADAPILPVT
jgi:hypothetical protein